MKHSTPEDKFLEKKRRRKLIHETYFAALFQNQ